MRNINLRSGNCVKPPINRKQYSNDIVFFNSHLIDFTHVVYFYNSSPSHRVLFREPCVVCYTQAKAMKTEDYKGPTYVRQRHREDQISACQRCTRDVSCQPALFRCDCFTRRRGVGNPVARSHTGLIFVKVTTALL